MSEHDSLLDRIACAGGARRPARVDSLAAIEAAVIVNIRRILSARQGLAPACPGYGMPELDHVSEGYAHAAQEFAARVKDAIERYERRITDVRILPPKLSERQAAEDPLLFTLDIKARLLVPGSRHRTRLDVTLSPEGRVEVARKS